MISFESWYKSWHVNEGIFHSGYVRGGGGYGLTVGRTVINSGWGIYNTTTNVICVE